MRRLVVVTLLAVSLAGCLGGSAPPAPGGPTEEPGPPDESSYRPHVVVGVPDSGINPYHDVYFRPNRTEHPCTYIRDVPCDIEALDLSVGMDNWTKAFERDRDEWEDVEPGEWYWIPQTVFVAVSCDPRSEPFLPGTPLSGGSDLCILDDTSMHGTGTTSSVVMENPDASIAFREGNSSHVDFARAGIPVDIFSVSWGYIAPIPLPAEVHDPVFGEQEAPIYVKAAGNDPRSTLTDSWSGDPDVISVGGGYAEGRSEEALATKQPDVVSYFCRPTAQKEAVHEMRSSYCGSSFAAPTVAGALSKVVLDVRESSGYDGSIADGYVDPVANVTIADLRDAMNRTASYDPAGEYNNSGLRAQDPTSIPLNPAAPWLQWGWGFYDALVAEGTTDHLLGDQDAPAKPEMARIYMGTVYDARSRLYD